MRRFFFPLALLILTIAAVGSRAAAQSQTLVSGNVVDPKGFFYAGGSVKATLYPPGAASPCVFTGPNCIPIPSTIGPVGIDFNGNFQVNLYPNALIFCNQTPCTTQWTFVISITNPNSILPQPIGTGDQSFSVTQTITGSSQSITTAINAAPPPLLTRIPVGTGGGCTPSGAIDTGVLSEHPVGSCYDSANATWNDASGKQNLQFGLSNTFGTPSALSFMFGQSNSLCSTAGVTNCSLVFAEGVSNSLEGAGNAGDTFRGVWVFGRNNNLSGQITDSYVLGGGSSSSFGSNFDTDAASSITNALCLLQGCAQGGGGIDAFNGAALSWIENSGFQNTISATGSGVLVQDIFMHGAFDILTIGNSSTDGSVASSVFKYGESLNLTDTGNSNFQDYYSIGSDSNADGTGTAKALSASSLRYMTDIGFVNTFLGNDGGTHHYMFAAGFKESLSNCSHCYAFGENDSMTASNEMDFGLSATPEFKLTVGLDTFVSIVDSAITPSTLPICAHGTGGAFTTTGCSGGGGTTVTSWAPDPGYGGSNTTFDQGAANRITLFAIPGPQTAASVNALSISIAVADATGDYSVGMYGPCALNATCSTAVCTITAQTLPSTGGFSISCSQGTVTINPITTAGQYYFLAVTGTAPTGQYSSSNGMITPVCAASSTTSSAGALPSSVVVPVAAWTNCVTAPLLLFHQ